MVEMMLTLKESIKNSKTKKKKKRFFLSISISKWYFCMTYTILTLLQS